MEWEQDRSLTIRMGLGLLIVAALPLAFIYAFVLAINTVGLDLLRLVTDSPWRGEVYVEPWLAVGAVLVGFVVQYVFGDRVALRSIGARRVDQEAYPDLHARVDRLAQTAALQSPRVAVSDDDVPNAFTVGFRPSKATVVVTEGLVDALDDDQLDAVLAHELAHIKNRDVAVMSLAYVLPSLTYVVAIAAFTVIRGIFHVLGSFHHVDNDDGSKGLVVGILVLIVSAIVTLALSVVFWVASFSLFRLVSQYREYAADRGAAAITGRPSALASALRRIDDAMSDIPDEDLRRVDGGLEALYVAPIDDYQFGEERELISSDIFPATHPSAEERIERLETVAAEGR